MYAYKVIHCQKSYESDDIWSCWLTLAVEFSLFLINRIQTSYTKLVYNFVYQLLAHFIDSVASDWISFVISVLISDKLGTIYWFKIIPVTWKKHISWNLKITTLASKCQLLEIQALQNVSYHQTTINCHLRMTWILWYKF